MLGASRCVSANRGLNLPNPIAKAGVVEDPTCGYRPVGWCSASWFCRSLRLQKPLVVSRFLLKIA